MTAGRVVTAHAPVRIADNGGWTDTWFAGRGDVVNIAVTPGVDVTIDARPSDRAQAVTLRVSGSGDVYEYAPRAGQRGPHPLLEAAIDYAGMPEGLAASIDIHSEMPPGASTGTSAAVTVALLAAVFHLQGRTTTPMALARAAHHVERDILGWQCGVQDQLAAAFGGISWIAIEDFPSATVTPLAVPAPARRALEDRLLLVFLGMPHSSSAVHEMVIADLERSGAGSPKLDALRRCAIDARDALVSGDLAAFGRALSANTDAQAALHPALIGGAFGRLIDIARAHGAAGWKVNGAGGDGGTLTILRGHPRRDRDLLEAIAGGVPVSRVIPIQLAPRGATVVEREIGAQF